MLSEELEAGSLFQSLPMRRLIIFWIFASGDTGKILNYFGEETIYEKGLIWMDVGKFECFSCR